MKLKERINKEIESNEGLSLLKKLWKNKRYRSLFWLLLYFIFFAIIIASARSNYQSLEKPSEENKTEESVSVKISESLENLDNYSYELLLNDEILLAGQVQDNTNTFIYEDKNYMVVGNNIYLENELNLTKVDLEFIIPITSVEVEDILKYIKDIEPISNRLNEEYSVSMSNVFESENINFDIIFTENESNTFITIDFSNYIKYKQLEYEQYILTIKLDKVKE